MHSVSQQQQQQRRSNSIRLPLMYSNTLPPASLLQVPPSTLRYGSISMKHHQRGGGTRGSRGLSSLHRQQQRTMTGFRHHPFQFRQPLPPQRFHRPIQPLSHIPAALMGTPPGMSQYEYERIHSVQVQRDKEKLVRQGHVLAPSNTTQFLISDHNRQTTPSSTATITTHQTNNSSLTNTQHQSSLSYDQMFEMGDVDNQSDDTESIQNIDIDPTFDDDDFNDIYYQCRYERYAAFSRTALLNEVLSLCANIDRLQHEKSEVEKRLRDVQQHLYVLSTQSNNSQGQLRHEEENHDDKINIISIDSQSKQETN